MQNLVVKTSNFDFLQERWPDLAQLASFAENYIYDDPASSLVKLRIFSETMVDILYYELGLEKPPHAKSFRDLLRASEFKKAIPIQIVNFLDLIRKEGNKGAHESNVQLETDYVIRVLSNVHQISVWFYKTVAKAEIEVPDFQKPKKPVSVQEMLARKAELERQLEELQKAQVGQRTEHPHEPATEAQKEAIRLEAAQVAETVGLTEEQTRKQLIDSLLAEAGWEIRKSAEDYDPHSGKPQALPEYPVNHQPTASGLGYADYVLVGPNGKPIAVIEAKKTARSAEDGQAQVKLYANGIEKNTDQRPVMFYTNGHDIFFWDDTCYPPRRVWGFYDLDKLEYLLFQRGHRKSLAKVEINTEITGRDYQLQCIRRVYESFELEGRRKALVVMATGTGKTRVAVSLVDGLMRANWVKRVLFLVDRNELRKQAVDAFKEHLPDETPVVITSGNKYEQNARVYVATYPTMINAYHAFNVGFFDLIIADESHRGIYNYYRELFQYFDTFQIGLTATPVKFISRNTFQFFDLPTTDPTFYFPYEDAVNHKPPYLVRFVVDERSTGFLRRGIKYDELTAEQKQQLEEQDEDPQKYNFEREAIDKVIMNRDTNRQILQNLMEKGLRDETGTRLGKTIIFARSHQHALQLAEIFNELYPQYKGKMAQVIDSQIARAEDLIDGFKGKKKEFAELDIAISVDMLDTGIDVPEVLNLVFAKPVYSKTKFWQMIGRGTRLCPKCQDWCQHKSKFLILDPWRNFEFFDMEPDGIIPTEQRSLPERLFSARLELLQATHGTPFANTVHKLLQADIDSLHDKSVSVRERWRAMERVKQDKFWEKLLERPDMEAMRLLSGEIMPLMRWRSVDKDGAAALAFDNKVARLQLAWVQNQADQFESYQMDVIDDVERIRTNLTQVKPHLRLIEGVQKAGWWQDITMEKLEELRFRLRGLMRYRRNEQNTKPKTIDVVDYAVEGRIRTPGLLEPMEAYKERLVNILKDLMASNLTLQKIHRGMPITEMELQSLKALILERDPSLKAENLQKLYPKESTSLNKLIRSIIGLDPLTVHEKFEAFRKAHTTLTANQMQFLTLLEQEIVQAGGIDIAKLYGEPFTRFHFQGLDGLFGSDEVDEILSIVKDLSA